MKIAVIMMQKNEDELVDKWADFHGALFGYENLYIFDNGSTSKICINKLKNLETLGCNINREYGTTKDFEAKGDVIGSKIEELETVGGYDFYFPLDCDEFLGVIGYNGKVSFNIEDIEAELSKYTESKEVLLNKGQYLNSPVSKEYFRFVETRKCFFYKGNFKSLDIGFHWGKNKHDDTEVRSNIIQVHFHQKPFDEIKKYALQKLSHRTDVTNLDKLKTYKGAGHHLVRYFFMNEFTYIKNTIVNTREKSTSLSTKFNQLNILWPYESKLQPSNLFINRHNISSFVQPCVVQENIIGGLGMLTLKGTSLILKGWAVNTNIRPATHFYILINESICLTPNRAEHVSRPDVEKIHSGIHAKLGFLLEFDIAELIHKNIFISTIALYPSYKLNSISTELSVQKEKIRNLLIQVNNVDYRSEQA